MSIWGTPNAVPNKDSSIILRDQEAFDQLLTANVPNCNQLLMQDNLRLAGIVPSGGELPSLPFSLSFLIFF